MKASKSTDNEIPTLLFPKQKDWADWLRKNHAKSSGVWLKLQKRALVASPCPTPRRSKLLSATGGSTVRRRVTTNRFGYRSLRHAARKVSGPKSTRRRQESLSRAGA